MNFLCLDAKFKMLLLTLADPLFLYDIPPIEDLPPGYTTFTYVTKTKRPVANQILAEIEDGQFAKRGGFSPHEKAVLRAGWLLPGRDYGFTRTIVVRDKDIVGRDCDVYHDDE